MPTENSKTILLVEDEAIIALMEKVELEKYGYIVHVANTGEKAVKFILDANLAIDFILMDIDLGSGIDGTLSAEIILKEKDIPVIFLSSHTEPEIVEKTEKITSYGYVVKNSGIVVLDASIKMALKLFNERQKRKLTEQELNKALEIAKKNENQYKLIFNSTGTSNSIFDTNGVLILQNDLSIAALGKIGTGLSVFDLFGQDIGSVIFERMQKVVKSGLSNIYESEFDLPSGKKWFRSYYQPIVENNNIESIHVISQDITDFKTNELKLLSIQKTIMDSEAKYKALFDNVSDAIFIYNPESLKIIQANKATEKLYGYSNSELLEMSCLDLSAEKEKSKKIAAEIIKNGFADVTTRHHKKKDGSDIYVHLTGYKIIIDGRDMLFSVCRDISARKQMEDKLNESELQYKNMANAGLALIWKSGLDKLCNYFNDPWLAFTGRTIEQEMGNGWAEGVHPDDFDRCLKIYTSAFDKCEAFEMEYRLRHVSGQYKIILDMGTPNYNSNGEFIGFIGHCFDITERKQAEEIIKRQLLEKEILLKEVHHRIKNNIYSIESLLALQVRSSTNNEVKIALQETVSRIQSTRVLYEKLLISKDYIDIPIKTYIDSLINSMLVVFSGSKNVTVEKNIEDFTINSKTALSIGIIINELVTNIFKYAFPEKENGEILIELKKIDNNVTLTIKDNGIGIDEKVSENKTQGFGLSIVKMLVEQLEGTFVLKNDSGTKSVIEFKM